MRQVLLGLLGVMAAGVAHAETYSFSSVINGTWSEQTLINCTGPKTNGAERVLHSQQIPDVPGIAACKGRVRFDKDGRAEC